MIKKRLFFLFLACACFTSFLTSCADEAQSEYEPKFNARYATEEREDGWVYYFSIHYPKEGESKPSYAYSAYNLKYKEMEGYTIPIYKAETSEIIDQAQPSLPYLILNQELKPELFEIKDFFENRNLMQPIILEEMKDLEISKIEKADVARLYNAAIENGDLSVGNFRGLSEADIVQEKFLSGYKWQIGYFAGYGNLLDIRIELIYEDGDNEVYLSDLISQNTGDEEQHLIHNKVKEIESFIMENQTFDILVTNDKIGNIRFDRLFNLINNLNPKE